MTINFPSFVKRRLAHLNKGERIGPPKDRSVDELDSVVAGVIDALKSEWRLYPDLYSWMVADAIREHLSIQEATLDEENFGIPLSDEEHYEARGFLNPIFNKLLETRASTIIIYPFKRPEFIYYGGEPVEDLYWTNPFTTKKYDSIYKMALWNQTNHLVSRYTEGDYFRLQAFDGSDEGREAQIVITRVFKDANRG